MKEKIKKLEDHIRKEFKNEKWAFAFSVAGKKKKDGNSRVEWRYFHNFDPKNTKQEVVDAILQTLSNAVEELVGMVSPGSSKKTEDAPKVDNSESMYR